MTAKNTTTQPAQTAPAKPATPTPTAEEPAPKQVKEQVKQDKPFYPLGAGSEPVPPQNGA